MDGFFCKNKVGNFGENPFVWDFLLGVQKANKKPPRGVLELVVSFKKTLRV